MSARDSHKQAFHNETNNKKSTIIYLVCDGSTIVYLVRDRSMWDIELHGA